MHELRRQEIGLEQIKKLTQYRNEIRELIRLFSKISCAICSKVTPTIRERAFNNRCIASRILINDINLTGKSNGYKL